MARLTALASLLCEAGYDWERGERLASILDREAPAGMSADDLFSALLLWYGKPRPRASAVVQPEQVTDMVRHRVRMLAATFQYWARDEVTTQVLNEEAQEALAQLF